jgi:hypothetical protein
MLKWKPCAKKGTTRRKTAKTNEQQEDYQNQNHKQTSLTTRAIRVGTTVRSATDQTLFTTLRAVPVTLPTACPRVAFDDDHDNASC